MPTSSRPYRVIPTYQGDVQLQQNIDSLNQWAGLLHVAIDDGRPTADKLSNYAFGSTTVATVTPTILTTSVARAWVYCCEFPIIVNRIRWWGIGAQTNHRVAVYRFVDSKLVIGPISLTSTANAWNSAAVSSIRLEGGIPYIVAWSTIATSTTAGHRTSAAPVVWPPLQSATTGNLRIAGASNRSWYGQFAVTTGVLPDPMPTLVQGSGWTGGLPLFYFDSNSVA
jgi:hypothetical protein